MRQIFLIDIEGTNKANIVFCLKNDFKIILIKEPNQILDEKPNLILPGNGSFGYYVSFLRENKWSSTLSSIIEGKGKGKLFSICSGFQALGLSSDESPGFDGLNLINYKLKSLKDFNSNLVINIGRKKLSEANYGQSINSFKFSKKFNININNPYFVHGYAAKLNPELASNYQKYCYLYSKINNTKFLAGIISEDFCATQFHPELSGSSWQKFMVEFFKS